MVSDRSLASRVSTKLFITASWLLSKLDKMVQKSRGMLQPGTLQSIGRLFQVFSRKDTKCLLRGLYPCSQALYLYNKVHN